MHETDETTITSFRPEISALVALILSFSISELIDRSFSIYVFDAGKYASG